MTTVLGSTSRIPADRMAGAISPRPPSSGTTGAAAVLGAGVTPWRANVNPGAAGGGLIAGMPIRSDGLPPKPPTLPPGPRPCMAPPARAGMPLMTAKPRLIRTTSQRFIGISQCTLAASRLALANYSCNSTLHKSRRRLLTDFRHPYESYRGASTSNRFFPRVSRAPCCSGGRTR